MSKFFLNLASSLVLLFQTLTLANEQLDEPQELASEISEEVAEENSQEDLQNEASQTEETSQEEASEETSEETSQEEASEEALAEETELAEYEDSNKALMVPDKVEEGVAEISEDEKEVSRAEEAELREVGAGEEPLVD